MPRSKDLLIAPLCEAALILIAGATAWALHKPLLFASLGPTAYELVETPERRTARPYNIIVGHLAGVAGALIGLFAANAWNAPGLSPTGVPAHRVAAAVIAAALTVLFTLALKATQPAAVATSLLLALGAIRGWLAPAYVMGAVILMTLIGEPLRHWREREMFLKSNKKVTS